MLITKEKQVNKMSKCVFMDRDGVLNKELDRHILKIEEFIIPEDVPNGLKRLKDAGYKLVVVTNQSGIARKYYDDKLVDDCHDLLQEACGNLIDQFYYAPLVDSVSKSLMRKPDSLMLEKGMAKFNVDPAQSWMVGDKERDLIPAKKLGIRRIQLMAMVEKSELAEVVAHTFTEVVDAILGED
ncbi:D-glycero-alpha-D-manno-heptose-1,7-bisphosphate 7-phosphatase [Roseivirga seohaensis]|uniref:D-glycero-alpha-D-manno-heptose-1,7-bisphosphate 7-phosphatase n=1 Tax=Roseivirga seohaensis TaxID=1914963 RepID=UPI003BAD1BFA